jgi:SPP1 gp7 family putative phage head morphogenesis protein
MPTPQPKRLDAARRAPGKQVKTLDAVRPNAGLAIAYQRKLESLVDDMQASLLYWLKSAYRANTPELASDAVPANELNAKMRELSRRWQRNFNRGSGELAEWFAKSSADRTDTALHAALSRAGFSVRFTLSDGARDVINATTFENVSLIKSIAQQHLAEVEGIVMRSVSQGRNLRTLTDELQVRYQITRKRAVRIAHDQTNKASASIQRTRQRELGVTEAVWKHSNGGKHPRESHVAMDGKRYDVNEGALIDGKRIWPGTEIWCRCYSKAVLPGFD